MIKILTVFFALTLCAQVKEDKLEVWSASTKSASILVGTTAIINGDWANRTSDYLTIDTGAKYSHKMVIIRNRLFIPIAFCNVEKQRCWDLSVPKRDILGDNTKGTFRVYNNESKEGSVLLVDSKHTTVTKSGDQSSCVTTYDAVTDKLVTKCGHK